MVEHDWKPVGFLGLLRVAGGVWSDRAYGEF